MSYHGPRRSFRAGLRWAPFALTALALLSLAGSTRAASPSFGGTSPLGAQRGTEVDVTLSGGQLADAQQVLLYWPGIEVLSLAAEGDGAVKARFKIATDCPLGAHPMRIRTATGITNLRTFSIGSLTETSEVEPNSDFSQPQAVAMDSCVSGVVDNEDVDYYVVEAKQGDRITAEIEAIRLGNTFFDPYISIMDERRFELSVSDDAALVWQDGLASIVAPADGKYIIQVRDSAFGGNGASTYRAHIGRFPRARAVLPSGGRPGESLEVRWLGDVLGERRETIALPQASRADFQIFASDDRGASPAGNAFRLVDLPNSIESEPNNALTQASQGSAPGAMNGVIESAGDTDWFKFTATKGQVLDLRVWARGIRSPLDPVLGIYKGDATFLAGNDDSAGPDSYLRFSVPDDGEYVISVQDHLNKGGVDYAYRVEVAPVAPQLTLGLPERNQFVDWTTAVPRGNRIAFLVSASRADFGGELAIAFPELPAGVSAEVVNMPGNQSITPVLFTATADAPLSGQLVDVVGRPTDANLAIEGHLLQTTSMVRGQNNIHVWDVNTQRMATAVTDEAPISIEIVEPKAPLVQNGTMELKVVARRKEGYTAAVGVRLLYNPPGVGSSGSVAIAEGQTEAIIPLNADGSAEVKTWKIAVVAEAPVAGGSVLVSSQLTNLAIAPPLFQFAFNAAAVEKGKETEVVIGVTKTRDFTGPARLELLGLPHEVTTAPLEFAPDATEVVFKVLTTANSPVGKHPTLLCRAVVMESGEPVTQLQGSGELRIDEPLPPKPMEAAPVAEAAPAPAAPTEKRLTLLEKLRLERKQRKEARAAAEAAPVAEGSSAPAGGM